MKAFLMFRDRDFNLKHPLPPHNVDLMRDLALDPLLDVMANGDEFIYESEKVGLLTSVYATAPEIQYRQWIMEDSLKNPAVVTGMYDLAVEALKRERQTTFYSFYRDSPNLLLHRACDVLRMFADILRRLRTIADASTLSFRSEGFRNFFKMIQAELNDTFFEDLENHLRKTSFADGLLMSAHIGAGNKGSDYVLREPPQDNRIWPLRLIPIRHNGYTLEIHPRDEAGAQALGELRNRGLASTARALAQATDHILSFFQSLRTELAFYVGAIKLHQKLSDIGVPVCCPRVRAVETCTFNARGLIDVSLALSLDRKVVGNDVNADQKRLIIITGANQGGKSTFLRSVGLAQLMAQAGLFVGAQRLEANVVHGIFTHYKREEDSSMKSGKFDEELTRMNHLVSHLGSNSIVLFNESFASTNEREGSEVAVQIVRALIESGVKVFFVTHLHSFASTMADLNLADALFLRAERLQDGARTFRLFEGMPLTTSFGKDLYRQIFAEDKRRPDLL